jgi:hypothetical protein
VQLQPRLVKFFAHGNNDVWMDIFARGRAGRSMKYDSPVKIFKLIVGALI